MLKIKVSLLSKVLHQPMHKFFKSNIKIYINPYPANVENMVSS